MAARFWISRDLFIRGLGLLHFLGGVIVLHQMSVLIGPQGLDPVPQDLPNPWMYPSLLLLIPSDWALEIIGWSLIATGSVLAAGFCNWILLLILYVAQLSLVNGGGLFYGFGWETMMVELTFTACFLTHPWRPQLWGAKATVPNAWMMLPLWWLQFRLMIGAGLIKLRGDECWWNLTCLDYHYETQPNPHFLSWFLHHNPWWFHRGEVLFNHFVELVVPWGLFLGVRLRRISVAFMALFQVGLILSGNLAFINWQTLVVILAGIDDGVWGRLPWGARWIEKSRSLLPGSGIQRWATATGIVMVAVLSLPVVTNLVSEKQAMNQSYSRWHLVNTYGLFGSITKERYEVVFFGTRDEIIGPNTEWEEYEFYCKPGRVDRRPCWITPYHLRLDWQMWFSAMRTEMQERWMARLVEMFLRNDVRLGRLGITNPFAEGAPPRWIKADYFRYRWAPEGDPSGDWWRRAYVKPYLEPARLQ